MSAESMQRFKHTFKRSKTPTGAEMKIQSSLEVPKQIRSVSFDEMKIGSRRTMYEQSSVDSSGLLQVPSSSPNQRSKSFDTCEDQTDDTKKFLEVPSKPATPRRKSSGDKSPPFCVHCLYLEEFNKSGSRQSSGEDAVSSSKSFTYSSSSDECSDSENDYADAENSTDASECTASPKFLLTVTLSPNLSDSIPSPLTSSNISDSMQSPSTLSPNISDYTLFPETLSPNLISPIPPPTPPSTLDIIKITEDEIPQTTSRRRSITSPKLERQEAFIFHEHQDTSLENIPSCTNEAVVSEFFLTVPDLKRDRAVSVDSCFINKGHSGKPEEVVPVPASHLLEPPPNGSNAAARSRSVDIVLPTPEQARYKALSTSNAVASSASQYPQPIPTTTSTSVFVTSVTGRGFPVETTTDVVKRQIRATPDWSEQAVNGDHLWVPTSVSGDLCYAGEVDCTKHGSRMKCACCKIIVHTSCIGVLFEKTRFGCKSTFRDVGIRQYREYTCIYHHWAHRRSQKGKCRQCGKSKLSFSSKEIVALSCSWCKAAYHNKETCFNVHKIEEECNLGIHSNIIVPPSWIVKLPRRGSFKSSLRKSPKKKLSSKKKNKDKIEKDQKTFVIKPIPTSNVKPVIVFINPKSGGNQGAKLLQKFQWLLNPRQVFDLTQGGPKLGLELFRKVPNLRVLACGGDGTVGWILSVLDQMEFIPPPPIGVLPLGTGNDLARALGWGGGYTDEPISKILCNIEDSDTTKLDRWELKVEKNFDAEPNEEGKETLPLNVVNNYFSFGVDAHIALEFHEAREANPQKFNSRLKNKMFYGQMGGKDLLKRKWKNLAEVVRLECDGKDLTSKLKDHKVHAIVFLNIPSYGGGTHPWNKAGANEQVTDDGLIEVIGLTTYQLPLLQAGGHGTCLCQCKTARIVTTKTIPMQVDGEACRLNPSIITIRFLNQAQMLSKRKGAKINIEQAPTQIQITVHKIMMNDYEQHHYDKTLLRTTAVYLGEIKTSVSTDLEHVRKLINTMQKEKIISAGEHADLVAKLSSDWCFVDSCTAERFFRIDRAQEHLHYLTDIAQDALFILDAAAQTPDDEPTCVSPSGEQTTPEYSPSEDTSKESSLENLIQLEKESLQTFRRSNASVDTCCCMIQTDDECGGPSESNNSITPTSKSSEKMLQAAKSGDLKLVKHLHNDGYSLMCTDRYGQTILHYASTVGYRDIVKYVLACAPPSIINAQDYRMHQTALHKAAAAKHRSICCMLVAGGAQLSVRDIDGFTPGDLARKANDAELAAYFENQEQFQMVSKDIETNV